VGLRHGHRPYQKDLIELAILLGRKIIAAEGERTVTITEIMEDTEHDTCARCRLLHAAEDFFAAELGDLRYLMGESRYYDKIDKLADRLVLHAESMVKQGGEPKQIANKSRSGNPVKRAAALALV
jgi:hypothetical protein